MPKEKKPFVDFRDIRSRITMEQVLEHYNLLGTFKRSGHSLSGPCPIHKGSNPTQFRVETEKNIWNCFSECKHGGNTLDFIARMENVSIHDAAIKACEWFNIPLEEVKTESSSNEPEESSRPATSVRPAPAPKAEDTKPNPPLKFRLDKLQREHPYLIQERGLTLETIIDFGLGYLATTTMRVKRLKSGCRRNSARGIATSLAHPAPENPHCFSISSVRTSKKARASPFSTRTAI